jgi:hypothetical protein
VTKPGELVLLGGFDIRLFDHLPRTALPGGRELVRVVACGEERVAAYAATAAAARSLLCSSELRPHGVPLLAVWPPLAYLPGPFMRPGASAGCSEMLLASPQPSRLHRVSDRVVPRLPRGRRVAAHATELVAVGLEVVRRAWIRRVADTAARRSSSYPPAS